MHQDLPRRIKQERYWPRRAATGRSSSSGLLLELSAMSTTTIGMITEVAETATATHGHGVHRRDAIMDTTAKMTTTKRIAGSTRAVMTMIAARRQCGV